MRNRIVGAFLLVSLGAWTAGALAQVEPRKAADIQRLIAVSGSKEVGTNWVTAFGSQLKSAMERSSSNPERTQQIVDAFIQKMTERFAADWTNLLVEIYDRHLTQDEVKGLIRFYESPLGRRLKEEMPKIFDESNAAGLKRGGELIQEILRGMTEQFPELKPTQ